MTWSLEMVWIVSRRGAGRLRCWEPMETRRLGGEFDILEGTERCVVVGEFVLDPAAARASEISVVDCFLDVLPDANTQL